MELTLISYHMAGVGNIKEISVASVVLNKITITNFLVGCIGAAVAWYMCYPDLKSEFWHDISFIPWYITIIMAPISGFLACFYFSRVYLKHIEDNTWQYGILPALVVSMLAGAISGFLTGMTCHPIIAIGGIYVGAFIGFIIGLISWLIFGKSILRFLVQN